MMTPRFWLRRGRNYCAAPPVSADNTEELLRAAALWEPDALPPADFTAFTRQALARRSTQSASQVRWAGALRSPLAVGLASACVLWVGGNQIAPYEAADATAPAKQVISAQAETTPKQIETGAAQVQTPDAVAAAGTATANKTALPLHLASRRVRHKNHFVQTSFSVKSSPAPVAHAALWKTETVERPAWGALVLVPFAAECNAASAVASGEETSEPTEGEAISAVMPVVLDVTLPDVETEMPVPTPSPTR